MLYIIYYDVHMNIIYMYKYVEREKIIVITVTRVLREAL